VTLCSTVVNTVGDAAAADGMIAPRPSATLNTDTTGRDGQRIGKLPFSLVGATLP
jgi:hypothetical protein